MSQDDAVLEIAERYLRDEVGPKAQEIDRDPEQVRWALSGLCERNLMAPRRPERYGGPEISEEAFRQFQVSCARYSGTLSFLQTQHQSAGSMIAKSDNEPLKNEYLPKMGNGEKLVGIGFSQLRRGGPPIMRATEAEGGYVLDGHVPWVTGFGFYPEFLLGATLPDGRALFVVAPLSSTPQPPSSFSRDPSEASNLGPRREKNEEGGSSRDPSEASNLGPRREKNEEGGSSRDPTESSNLGPRREKNEEGGYPRREENGQGGFRISPPMKLAAMEAANTVTVDFEGYFIPMEKVCFIREAGWIKNNDQINIALQGHFALGCAQAGLDILHASAEKKNLDFARDAFQKLSQELAACREQTRVAQQGVALEEATDERLQVRAWAIDLAVRCAHAAVTASSGAANSIDHPAQRVYREALVYTVSAQTTPIMQATLERLVRGTAE